MKKICIHGVTGSIGTQAIDVILQHPDDFLLVAMSFGNNVDVAVQIAEKCKPRYVACADETGLKTFLEKVSYAPECGYGSEAIANLSAISEVDVVLNGIMGSAGLKPTIEAIKAQKIVAIANKEPLVMAGSYVTSLARHYGATILPVDSEHSAIFQCLAGENKKEISKLIITASGGSFRDYTREMLSNVSVEQTLNHPNWSMGAKITVDSATLVNKGLEVIEAHWLFDIPFEKIDTVQHRQSIVHSMVEFTDHSVLAHLGTADMRIPIQYALSYPDRMPLISEPLDLIKVGTLQFEAIRHDTFPLLLTAYQVGKKGGAAPIVFNAANEAAVSLFLNKQIAFLDIERVIFDALEQNFSLQDTNNVEEIIALNTTVYEYVKNKVKKV